MQPGMSVTFTPSGLGWLRVDLVITDWTNDKSQLDHYTWSKVFALEQNTQVPRDDLFPWMNRVIRALARTMENDLMERIEAGEIKPEGGSETREEN